LKSITELLVFYQSYHRKAGCKATHFIGVPLVTYSILIPMGWLRVPIGDLHLTLAMAFVAGTLLYYFRLDRTLGAIMTLVMIPLTLAADWTSRLPLRQGVWLFLATFVLGWVFQLAGHAIEGRRPALRDNFSQAVFTAPLFLVVEVLFALGCKQALRRAAEAASSR
jgi:uncharacterized membrane protein YGL010W